MADGARNCFRKISAIAARCLSATRHSVIKGSGPLALCCRFQRRPAAHDRNVRFGSKADMCSAKRHVRFTPDSGHCRPALFDVWQLYFLNERRIVARCPQAVHPTRHRPDLPHLTRSDRPGGPGIFGVARSQNSRSAEACSDQNVQSISHSALELHQGGASVIRYVCWLSGGSSPLRATLAEWNRYTTRCDWGRL
jgi:hypothetical protein